MQRYQNYEHETSASEGGTVQPLHAGDDPDPRLERTDEQYHSIDDGKHQQVAVDGRR